MRKHFPQIFMLLVLCIGTALKTKAQADTPDIPKPVIKGDALLCPDSKSTLRTQRGYDTYQWYKRNFGSNRKKLIEGATSNELVVSSQEAPAYFSVVVTVKNIKLESDELLVDGLVFLLPAVKSSGDFKNGPGYFVLKEGDTGIFTLTKPYRTNITWYKNNEPIPGDTSFRLAVTEEGVYTVQGAPRTCPDYIVGLGVDLIVQVRKNNKVPVITGDTMLCPNQKGTLTTYEGYNSYQWYKRPYGQNKKTAIKGANTNTLTVDPYYDAPAWFSVETTINGDTLSSEEKLVDSWAFLPPSVISDGDFTYGPTYFGLNKGDTGTFTLTQPYTTNIAWFRNGEPMPGETSPTLYVTDRGYYTVEGAPAVCPDYIQSLGLVLRVKLTTDDGFTANDSEAAMSNKLSAPANIKLYPNPARDHVMLDASAFAGKNISVRVLSNDGKTVLTQKFNAVAGNIRLELANVKPGMYYVEAADNTKKQVLKLVVTK